MKYFHLLIMIFLSLAATSIADRRPRYAKEGCDDTCGNVSIPYPFGIGRRCSVNEWYVVECNASTPYLSAPNYHLQVLSVSLENQTVTVNMPERISDCQNPESNNSQTTSIDLGGTPFLYSWSRNKFVYEGCGNALILHNGSVLNGCSTTCWKNGTVSDEKNKCVGIHCCQTTIPYYLKSYSLQLTGCGSAFLVDEDLYIDAEADSFVPVSLLWTLTDVDSHQVTCCGEGGMYIETLDTGNGTNDTRGCYISMEMEGNPYLIDGCQVTEECAKCEIDGGYCNYPYIRKIRSFNCTFSSLTYAEVDHKLSLGVILGT